MSISAGDGAGRPIGNTLETVATTSKRLSGGRACGGLQGKTDNIKSSTFKATALAGMDSALTTASSQLLAAFYTRVYPSADEVADGTHELQVEDMQDVVDNLRREVEVLREETSMLASNVELIRSRRAAAAGGNPGVSDGRNDVRDTGGDEAIELLGPAVLGPTANSNLGLGSFSSSYSNIGNTTTSRRGKGYRRKSLGEADTYVQVEDKMDMVAREAERLRQQEERADREFANVKDVLLATVEEAVRRLKELRLEKLEFRRDVIGDGDDECGVVCADDVLRYMERRAAQQRSYLDKLQVQCQAAEQDIVRAQQQLRQHRTAGEAFHAVDFEQLRIENQQFNERIDKKNAELADLKGVSTRTVQMLNKLMDLLNTLSSEQGQLKKELKSRSEYLVRCSTEVDTITVEAARTGRKNASIKAQHEAVKVPKIEEYIAQKAELHELQKAEKNWKRKVEIAEGQLQVMNQSHRSLISQRDAAVAYTANKRKNIAANAKRISRPSVTPFTAGSRGQRRQVSPALPPASLQVNTPYHGMATGGRDSPSHKSASLEQPVVGSKRSLLSMKRMEADATNESVGSIA